MRDSVCNFEVGDKVVCVDAKFFPGVAALYTALPAEGRTYVVRDLRLGVALDARYPAVKTGEVSVLLVGIVNPPSGCRSKLERGFAHWRFRKLDEVRAENEEFGEIAGVETKEKVEV